MKITKSIVVFLCTFFLTHAYAVEPIKLPSDPALSPDGKLLAFCYEGDIWTVPIDGGKAMRLTSHEAYERKPIWSPDGRKIAFSSDRYGNDDLFVIDLDGGMPQRVTHFSGKDSMCDWTPKGDALIFNSRRDEYRFQQRTTFYKAELEGGIPGRLMGAYGFDGRLSPDGKWLAFVRGGLGWERKNYRGTGNTDIWLFNIQENSFRQLTTHNGGDSSPSWSPDSRSIYYRSDEDGTFNLWKMDIYTSQKQQLTFYKDDGIRFPSAARNADVIAFEYWDSIYTISTSAGQPTKVEIYAHSDIKRNLSEWKTYTRDANQIAVSPDNKQIAFDIRGEIYVIGEEKGGTANQITKTPHNDREINWASDSESFIFVSDRNGNDDIFSVTSDDSEEKRLFKTLKTKVTQLTESPEDERRPRYSPDGEKIAYIRGNGDLMIMDKDGTNKRVLSAGWNFRGYDWSPDSKWIAFGRGDNEFNTDVFIIPADGSQEPVNITQHPDEDGQPAWSKNGRILCFVSKRTGDDNDIWFVFLRKDDFEKTKEELEEAWGKKEKKEKEEKDEEEKEEEGEEKKKQVPEIKIDLEDIHKRLRRVTNLPGNEWNPRPSHDAMNIIFASSNEGKSDIWSIKWDGSELKRITTGGVGPSYIEWNKDGKKIYYRKSDGTIHSISSKGTDKKNIKFSARLFIDHKAEIAEVFDQGWRAIDRKFYDANFNGVDWKAMNDKYKPLALAASTKRDFFKVFNMMLGELNASHLGIRGGEEFGARSGSGVSTGMLGLTFDKTYSGLGLKVLSVLPKGPADRETSRINPGEIILSINGKKISPQVNIHKLLADTIDQRVLLEVLGADEAEPHEVVIRPISMGKFIDRKYDQWVEERRKMVEELSDGRFAYLHIRGMSQASLDQFEQELYSIAHGKEGLIVDVRNNGGGWTTDMMLAILNVRDHAYTIPRNGGKGYPQDRRPLYAWTKPAAALCNEHSFSNAEIFSHAFKTLGRGPLIGQTTFGGVISTSGTNLIDGTYIRIPSRGWYVKNTGLNMELHGAVPDYIISHTPMDEVNNRDAQLAKAMEVLMEIVKEEADK